MQAANWALDAGRWADAIRLVKSLEGALAQSGRWDAWSESLSKALAAAQAQGDQSTMAWALHQIGTRSMCLAEKRAARAALIQALRLREALGDRAGAAVSRHNLRVLLGPPPPPRKPSGDSGPPADGAPPNGASPTGVPASAAASGSSLLPSCSSRRLPWPGCSPVRRLPGAQTNHKRRWSSKRRPRQRRRLCPPSPHCRRQPARLRPRPRQPMRRRRRKRRLLPQQRPRHRPLYQHRPARLAGRHGAG